MSDSMTKTTAPAKSADIGRGYIGLTPRATTLSDESYLEYVQTFRKMITQDMFPIVESVGEAQYEAWKAEHKPNANTDDLDDIKREFRKAPVTLAWQRFLRSQQEMLWRRTRDSFVRNGKEILKKIQTAESQGPGKLIYSDDFKVPAYTRQEIHLQPGGFTDDPLGGVVFHYGTMVFYEGINDQDELYKELADLTVLPEGKCDRVLDVACAIGQGTMALKELYPDVEVTGLDVGLPLIKYGHYRAVERGLDVTFTQGLAEDMPYDDGHFDAILSYLLYHEVAEDKIEEIVQEIYRVLRPGGVFTIFDFPNNYGETLAPAYRFLIDFDSRNNCEPYSVGFVHCDFLGILRRAGFEVSEGPKASNPFLQPILAKKPL